MSTQRQYPTPYFRHPAPPQSSNIQVRNRNNPSSSSRRLSRTTAYHPLVTQRRLYQQPEHQQYDDNNDGEYDFSGSSASESGSETETDEDHPKRKRKHRARERHHDGARPKKRVALDGHTTKNSDNSVPHMIAYIQAHPEKLTAEQLTTIRQIGAGPKQTHRGLEQDLMDVDEQEEEEEKERKKQIDDLYADGLHVISELDSEFTSSRNQLTAAVSSAVNFKTSLGQARVIDDLVKAFNPVISAYDGEKLGAHTKTWLQAEKGSRAKIDQSFEGGRIKVAPIKAKAAAEAAKIRAAEEDKKRLMQEALGDFDLILANQGTHLDGLRTEFSDKEAKCRNEAMKLPDAEQIKEQVTKEAMSLLMLV